MPWPTSPALCPLPLHSASPTPPYALRLADKGWRRACADDPGLAEGVNITDGKVTYPGVAEAFGMTCFKIDF